MNKRIFSAIILFGGGFFTGVIFIGKIYIKTKFSLWNWFDTLIITLLIALTFFIYFVFESNINKGNKK